LATCWDLAAVHRGVVRRVGVSDPGLVWAALHNLDAEVDPGEMGQLDLLRRGWGRRAPTRITRYARTGICVRKWVSGGWARAPQRWARWAATALAVSTEQGEQLLRLRVAGDPDGYRPVGVGGSSCCARSCPKAASRWTAGARSSCSPRSSVPRPPRRDGGERRAPAAATPRC